jgi:hypothetical protein
MSASTRAQAAHAQTVEVSPWAIVVVGMLALAVAMGIGRFAFTPLLPMMLNDGVIDLPGASWLASANYLGYLLGALLCTFQPFIWRRFSVLPSVAASTWARAGLVATCVFTLGMALHLPWLWPVLRFAAGVASAFVFVFTSGWCLGQLAARNAGALGAAIYAGPGAGIVLSGLFASGMVAVGWSASSGWLTFGVLAIILTTMVWQTFHQRAEKKEALVVTSVGAGEAADPREIFRLQASRQEMLVLALAYGLAGFGYIVTATFLPVIARQALPASALLDMFWPLFGVGVVAGALLSSRISLAGDLRHWLAGCYAVQAMGIAVSIFIPTLTGFALSSLLLGLPFTAITFFAMQEVRRLRPLTAPAYMGLLTAMYGLGQIAGPPMVAVLLRRAPSLAAGFTLSLEIAGASLLLGMMMYAVMLRIWPKRQM